MVKTILEYNHIEVSSRCTSASDVTLSFSCPASVSEVVLEQLENIGMDSWYGRIYVTACDLYRSSEEAEASLLKETMTSRLILVQEMINLIHDGAACTFDYVLLLISAGLMAALGLAGNSHRRRLHARLATNGPDSGHRLRCRLLLLLTSSQRHSRPRAHAHVPLLRGHRHPALRTPPPLPPC